MPVVAMPSHRQGGLLLLFLALAALTLTHAFHFKPRTPLPTLSSSTFNKQQQPRTFLAPSASFPPLVRRQAEYLNQIASPARSKRAPAVQWGALGKWVLATGLQFASILAFMYGMEQAFAKLKVGKDVSLWVVRAFFAFMSLRSRVFSILDNSRPSVASENRKKRDKKRPAWMPPAKAFPIIWISIGVLRTIASSLIYETTGTLLCEPIYALFLHLSIGDTWNTLTNVENRTGASVPGVFLVWLSVVNAVRLYNQTLPLAGKVLLPSAVWISIANVLVFSIWRLNGSEPLYPHKRRRE